MAARNVIESPGEFHSMSNSMTVAYLKKFLVCPVCGLSVSAPVQECRNGHTVCGVCTNDTATCPICSKTLLRTRSRTLENIVDRFLGRKCENHIYGCVVRLRPGRDLEQHEIMCTRRKYRCLLCGDGRKVLASHLYEHCWNAHGHRSRIGPTTIFDALDGNTDDAWLVKDGEDVFWFWKVAKKHMIHLGLELCGKTKGHFMYNLKVSSNSKREISLEFFGRVHRRDDHKCLYNLRPCEKCVSMGSMMFRDGAKVEITISRDGSL